MKSLNFTSLSDGIACPAPAKLNLFLHITGRRDDGYHLLQTVFQFIGLRDELTFRLNETNRIELEDVLSGVPQSHNLVYRAAELLQTHAGISTGIRIGMKKRIPMGAGLGGGSSDAATTLIALNQCWKLGLSQHELVELGGQLGADVPVFIHGEACWAEGTGDIFEPIALPEPWYLILKPRVSIATSDLFSTSELTRNCSRITIRDFLAGEGSNVFEPIVRQRHKEVASALDWLHEKAGEAADEKVNTDRVAMTGTGSSVFLSCSSQAQAQRLAESLPNVLADGCEHFVAKAHNLSPLYQQDVQ